MFLSFSLSVSSTSEMCSKTWSSHNCSKKGDCGFILRVTAASGKPDDSFNIQLVINPDLYPDEMHCHEGSLKAENMHLVLDMYFPNNDNPSWTNISSTWKGKPRRDGTNRFWCWGEHRFYKKGEGSKPTDDPFSWAWLWGTTAKIRPVVYYSYWRFVLTVTKIWRQALNACIAMEWTLSSEQWHAL